MSLLFRHSTGLEKWDDIRILPTAFVFAGASDPTLSSWQPGAAGATFKVYEFNSNNEGFFTVQLPHSYKEGTDLKAHVHWTPRSRGNEEDTKTVFWKMDYSIIAIAGTFLQSTTVDMTDTCNGTDDEHNMTPELTISGTGLGISSVLVGRLYRDAGDTWVTNTAGNRPALLELDLHFQKDDRGSNTSAVK